jgi:predicted CXXCH cytochrome family protein
MRLRRTVITLAAALGAAVALVPIVARAAPPFSGTAPIALGDSATATFGGFDDEVHQYTFLATKGSVLDATVSADGGAKPSLRLASPGGRPVDVGRAQKSDSSIRGYRFDYAGTFVLEVTPRGGAGTYRLQTGGHLAKRLRGIAPHSTGDGTWEFYAADGAAMSVTLTPRGGAHGAAAVRITGLTDPSGADVTIDPHAKGATSRLTNVALHGSGKFVLAYTMTGRTTDLALDFSFVNPTGGASFALGTAAGLSPGLLDTGHPAIAARKGYVGSAACGRCHGDKFTGWSQTAHNLGARTWNRAGLTGRSFVNDADGNGADDFHDGLDLGTRPAFASLGANAPKLSFSAGAQFPYKVRIGAATYDVERVMGGNGLARQTYLVRIGASLYPAPFQYDETVKSYSLYESADWYEAEGGAPKAVAKDRSFEVRCSGCHNTGATISAAASGDFQTGYVEFNIGCEQCHGPGAEHAKMGDPAKIKNPGKLLDGTAAGVVKANDLCGRCHTRGDAHDAVAGTAAKPPFGYSAAGGVQQAFDDPSGFLTETTKAADFWGRKTNPFAALPGDTFNASRSSQQESIDLAHGEHAPDSKDKPTCFSCHDAHGSSRPHLVAEAVDRGGSVPTRTENNSLCLSCHAGSGDFLAVTKIDVAALESGAKPVSVVRAVVDHMKDSAGMPVTDDKYDPAGTGVGRCDTCHMARMSQSGAPGTDKAGFAQGDGRSHTFEPVWPNASVLYGVTNSCNVCHPTVANDPTAAIITQWATKGADGDSTFHADTPRSIQNGTANAGSASGGARCAGCHTTEGFVRIQVKGETLDQAEIDKIVKESIARDEGITCKACHGRDFTGTFRFGANPTRFDKAELCGKCHNGQTVVFADFQARGEPIRHPQKEMLDNTAGAEPPGSGLYNPSFHVGLEDSCVVCHFDQANHAESHEFQAKLTSCQTSGCHPGLATFNRTARADYDGDGVKEGIQDEVDGLLAAVRTALLLDVRVTYSASSDSFDFNGATDHKLTGASDAQKRAVFNYASVKGDASRGVHNTARAVKLLQQSYKELTGVNVPNAVLR